MLGRGLESLIPSIGNNKPDESLAAPPSGAVPSSGLPHGNGQIFSNQVSAVEPQSPPAELARPVEEKASGAISNSTLADQGQKPASPLGGPAEFPAKLGKQEKKDESQKKSGEDYIFHIEVKKIVPNPNQPRKNFNEEGIRELAYSIREFGFLQPLVVTRIEEETPVGVDVSYELIAGERRLLAAKLLGLELVPAIVRDVDLEREKLELAVIENIQRENLNPLETARAFQRLQEEFRMTQREIAAKLGKSRETVANSVRLLDLPSYAQEALERGQISESHGRFLLAIEDPGAQRKLFDDIVRNHLTIRDVRDRVRRAKEPEGESAESAHLSPELKMMQERLSAELGTPVSIHKKGETGKIEITFYSAEELQNILNKFGTEG